MKLINPTIAILVLLTNVACSKEESQPAPTKPAATTEAKPEAITVYSSTKALYNSKDTAMKALGESKQVDQAVQDSAAQQRKAIEETAQ